jgi:hypothetical protein
MPAIQTTRRFLTAYADRGQGRGDHDEAQACLDVEEKLAWGVPMFQGLLEVEARAQARARKGLTPELEQLLEMMPVFYGLWAEASEFYLDRAREFVAKGHHVEGVDALQAAIEEARCLLGNLELEEQMRPIEELIAGARPENPSPERYSN